MHPQLCAKHALTPDDNKAHFARFLVTIALSTAYLVVVGLAQSVHRWNDHVETAIHRACDVCGLQLAPCATL